jgi:primosomal protein N' (replication factor Y)
MVGTQMIAKGLDLPLVTLVGIISADTALNLPDFRAGERSFQLLTQVAGRAGRSLLGGQVVLQTYQPEHYAVAAAANHDYQTFYEREVDYRRDMGYPPFRRMARILFRYPNEVEAQRAAETTATRLRNRIRDVGLTGTELIGPAPCFFTRIGGHYRWHLLLRGPDPAHALRGMSFDKHWYVDVDPVDVL